MKTRFRGSAGSPGSRFHGFQELMRHRVQDILLVSSLYDSFILEEDGQLNELLLSKFLDLNLRHAPSLTRVSTGAEALALAGAERRFNLIITTMHVGDMNALELARQVKASELGLPIVLLAYDNRELSDFMAKNDVLDFDQIFLWQGDARILLAIVKYVEDKLNVDHDTAAAGVQVILLVEDSIRYYSSFLSVIDTELLHHQQQLIAEGVNLSHKILRLRARPKILLAVTFEQAWAVFTQYQEHILGIISDIEFTRDGKLDRAAGLELARRVREARPDVPVLLESSRPENAEKAHAAGASFLRKGSPVLLNDLRRFMIDRLGFGDFVFRLPSGAEVGRASDLQSLEEKLKTVPAESILFHGQRNHFSNWFKARTEFELAHKLRPRRVDEFRTLEELRESLIQSIHEYRREQVLDTVTDFSPRTFDLTGGFARIGGGSLGGKARGLAFCRRLLASVGFAERFPGVDVSVPAAVVLATDVFDEFLDENRLRDLALQSDSDEEILEAFTRGRFPAALRAELRAFLELVREPLAVRSSSLLEDAQYQPFTGVYETVMLPNDELDANRRLSHLLAAIARVYASTFSSKTKNHVKATQYRLEEEKMAVILQRVVGARRGDRYYPDFAGVARSQNFYPSPPFRAEDGIAAVALGLGRTVIEGDACLRFCPRYPLHLLGFSSVDDMLANSQREFWALSLGRGGEGVQEKRFDLSVADADGTLNTVASTYSRENDAVYDGVSRPGIRLVSFAPILKHKVFPLAEILDSLLDLGSWGTSAPVEIEFAVNLETADEPKEFAFLQLRPLTPAQEVEEVELRDVEAGRLICRSPSVLGHGKLEGIRDIVVVDRNRFDRARSREVAREVAQFNAELAREGASYVLIGVGRWGSADPWLGIPVTWEQISGARAIVESGFQEYRVTPSQGSHFFQNLLSFSVGYFTVNPEVGQGFVDWHWLASTPAVAETHFVRWLRLDRPVVVWMNGKKGEGVIWKP